MLQVRPQIVMGSSAPPMSRRRRTPCGLLTVLLGGALLAACGVREEAPARTTGFSTAVAPASTAPYVIQPGDDLEVKFQLTPELNERQVVRPDGRISLQLVDSEIAAAGLTVEQLRTTLRTAYANQLREPQIAVLVREFSQNRVFVGGEVGLTGPQPLTRPTTVRQAILQAQGFKDTAYPSQVILYRQTAGGPTSWQVLNLKEYPSDAGGDQDVLLAPLDIVFVPRSPVADVGRFVEVYIRRLLPISPSILLQ
ncbi:MAG: polysaccharide export protein [Proteobacteria bacterium]|nr:polysaccharide export protein [Pseudomonadota bacterium]